MDFDDLKDMPPEELAANNQATFRNLIEVKLDEVDDLMEVTRGTYSYPFAGSSHEERKEELIEHLLPIAEAMGIEAFLGTPVAVTIACACAAVHREEEERLPKMLHLINKAFMAAYGTPETSDHAVSLYGQMLFVLQSSIDSENNSQGDEPDTEGYRSAQESRSIH